MNNPLDTQIKKVFSGLFIIIHFYAIEFHTVKIISNTCRKV